MYSVLLPYMGRLVIIVSISDIMFSSTWNCYMHRLTSCSTLLAKYHSNCYLVEYVHNKDSDEKHNG